MQHVVIIIHLMLVLTMIALVLLQRSEGGGLGIGGGGGGGFMTSRGTANVLTRATAILAGLFFCTSLFLSILASMNRAPTSILDGSTSAPVSAPGGGAPPLSGQNGGGLLNQLGGAPSNSSAPAAPAAPTGPQVPASK